MNGLNHNAHVRTDRDVANVDVWTFGRLDVSRRRRSRRGVSSVLAMMFLVIFSSLAAAMAVVAQANLRTADSALKLSRAMSAAETGMVFAQRRLASETSRFVVEKGVIDDDFAEEIWLGTYDVGSDGNVEVLDPTGYTTTTPPSGLVYAMLDAHQADEHTIDVQAGDNLLPDVDDTYGTLRSKPIALSSEANSPYFRLMYEMVAGEPYVRVTSTGYDGDISRTIMMDFRINKKIEFAILSPNRIMIGKNVLVDGPLGSRYGLVAGELTPANGDPLVMRSDFYYLDDSLNTQLDLLYTQVKDYDVDGDNRLRPDHPDESDGLSGHSELEDYDGDEYVTDFDLFLKFYDADGDMKIDLASEFINVDAQLARLIDQADADRDGDGEITASDTGLGYDDGVIDVNDFYAKVRGYVGFAIAQAPWDTANGAPYQTIVQGPVTPAIEQPATTFEVTDEQMREITTAMFDGSQSWFDTHSQSGDDFADQITAGGTYTPAASMDYEPVPYGSSGAYDYYKRPKYEDMVFNNVRIPKGNNGLFVNCTFIGVTFIESNEECADFNWNYAGAVERKESPPGSGNYTYPLRFPSLKATIPSSGAQVADTRTESNNIRFDGCTFLGSIAGDKPDEYTHWRNKLQFTGNTRFYIDPEDNDLAEQTDAATLTGHLNDIDDDDRAEMEKSSMLLPGWSVDVGNFNNEQAANPEDTAKVKLQGTIIAGILDVRGTADVFGTLLMTYRPVEGQGPLYYGGLTDAFNTTIGYFGSLDGDGEGSTPGSGSFQGFGEITLRYNPDAKLPDGIPWPLRCDPDPTTYTE